MIAPTLSHTPWNWGLTCLFAEQLARDGHPGASVAVLVGFDCCLRIFETGALRVCDVNVLEKAVRDGTNTPVSLARCKTGDKQKVLARRESVSGLLAGCCLRFSRVPVYFHHGLAICYCIKTFFQIGSTPNID